MRKRERRTCKTCSEQRGKNKPFIFTIPIEVLICSTFVGYSKQELLLDRRDLGITILEKKNEVILKYDMDNENILIVSKRFDKNSSVWNHIKDIISILYKIEADVLKARDSGLEQYFSLTQCSWADQQFLFITQENDKNTFCSQTLL